ncbi:nitroreductase family protein [Stutzerimonas kirkiae]|uniref:Putative NAD(P)H nitroreductase n=1 Tax=Stutzerimonas kirkiae TaxID=2211392 RepID=A0A4Q9R985_9GAMM|nr:nitroreductase [Stutzerimonas kirkiae]TBU97233.1 nitroreductase [Stutzerimonas kirkiae]TBV03655.1 nitroreductase [Stutzerimonas kirkiae]TBV11359.1 nitroreductase [Stutzerimonas kirkiae]TBV12468.1 nitroreductase [Stutzerimonas kirkiae]
MKADELLLERVSVARLGEPGPTDEQLDGMFRAALRAPDHGQLRPWRFLTVSAGERRRLGELYAEAVLAKSPGAAPEALEKARNMPLRAPLVIVVIARPQEHPKVPRLEQLLAAGCAAHGLLLSAHAQGLGAIWRTGEMAFERVVEEGLGLSAGECILGFIYVGTPLGQPRNAPHLEPGDFVKNWPDD